MSDDSRSVLRNLHKPVTIPVEAEQALLGKSSVVQVPQPDAAPAAQVSTPPSAAPGAERTATVPVTFHLPVSLRDHLKRVALARKMTMVNLVRQQLENYLAENPLTEAERQRLLGL